MAHVELTALWLPILLSAAGAFVASSIIWMALPFLHKNDYKGFPKEDAMLAAIREQGAAPGLYMFPWCSHKDWKNPDVQARFNAGPWGLVCIKGAKCSMGTTLPIWFAYLLVVSTLIGYVASMTLFAGADAMGVFRVVFSMALAPYVLAAAPASIWEMKPWGNTFRHMIDGAIYAAITGAAFAWLWPKAGAAAGAAQTILQR